MFPSLLPSLLFKVSLLASELSPLFPFITSMDVLQSPVKPSSNLYWFYLNIMQCFWNLCNNENEKQPCHPYLELYQIPWGLGRCKHQWKLSICLQTMSTWILHHQMRPGFVPSFPHLRQEEGFHCPSVAVNLTGIIPLRPYTSTKYCWEWLTASEDVRRDGQSRDKQSPNLHFDLKSWKSTLFGVQKEVSWGFTSFSSGISKPELVCKSWCLLFAAAPNKLLFPCYIVVIYLWQTKRLLMISPQGCYLLL